VRLLARKLGGQHSLERSEGADNMARYTNPDFNERAAASRAAKETALERLRNKPAPDPALVAEREAALAAREAAAAERRAARQLALQEAKAVKEAEKAAAAQAKAAPKRTEAELKAARDAKYAARKARKR
jgi:hypothetical protein